MTQCVLCMGRKISRINFHNGGIFDPIWLHLNKVMDEQKTPILSSEIRVLRGVTPVSR